MLPAETIAALAEELADTERERGVIPRPTARHPEATVEDSYAIRARGATGPSPWAAAWSAARSV
ncbi:MULTISPECIES: hypothetical protein [unclassified Streptomyces]|uniref:hypothetical protein n=1 Tax=unclassified Streptomyces TaxID=2593676 RepID=UPI0003A70560|nr:MULTISPECIES: hypothetical protein [unclassified Streptomyces]